MSGELKADFSVLERLNLLLRGIRSGRLSMLLELRRVADYMKKVKELYAQYPENPDDLQPWVARVEDLYKQYKKEIGVTW